MSSGIGAAAEVLVNLYLNDHRPKTQATSPDLVRKCTVSLDLKIFAQPPWQEYGKIEREPFSGQQRGLESWLDLAEVGRSHISSKTNFTWVLVVDFPSEACALLSMAFRTRPAPGSAGMLDKSLPSVFSVSLSRPGN